MPLYEFFCSKCNMKFEELLSINDDNPQCPKCKKITKRLISRVWGIVKGSENRSLDCVIGASAEKNWQRIKERKQKRQKS